MSEKNEAPERIKPCPFCGNDGSHDPRHTFSHQYKQVAVRCGNCEAMGSLKWSEAFAIIAWNRRADLAQPAPTGEPTS